MEQIFVCYSRADRAFALQLKDALEARKRRVWIDLEDLPASSIWRKEIADALTASIALVYLVSSNSLRSQYCRQELEFAQGLNKRVFPILLPGTTIEDVPESVSERQWLLWSDFKEDLSDVGKLINDLETDYEWLKFVTELGIKASRWEQRKDNSRLLRGKELREADNQLSAGGVRKDPKPTDLEWKYVLTSRRHEENQRRRLTTGASAVALAMVVLAILAWLQRNEAIRQMDIAQSRQLSLQSSSARLEGNFDLAFLLGIEALDKSQTFEAEESLLKAFESSSHLRAYVPAKIDSFAVGPDGRLLATTNKEKNEVGLWRLSDDGLLLTVGSFHPSAGNINWKLSFNYNGHILAIGGAKIELWDISIPGTPLFISEIDETDIAKISYFAFSPNAMILAVAHWDGQVVFWNLQDLEAPVILSQIFISLPEEYDGLGDLAFSSDGLLMAVGSSRGMVIVDMSRPRLPIVQTKEFISGSCGALYPSFSPAKDVIAANDCDEDAGVWDISSIASPKTITESILGDTYEGGGENSGGRTVMISPAVEEYGGLMMASASCSKMQRGVIPICLKSEVYLWDGLPYQRPYLRGEPLSGHTGNIRQMAFTPDGHFLATLDTDQRLILWDTRDFEVPPGFASVAKDDNGSIFAFSSDSSLLVTANGNSGENTVWRLSEDGMPEVISLLTTDGPSRAVSISPKKDLLATGSDAGISLWNIRDPTSPHYLVQIPHRADVKLSDVMFSRDEKILYVGSRDGTVALWSVSDARSANLIAEKKINAPNTIMKIAFSPTGEYFISADSRGTVRAWKLSDFSMFASEGNTDFSLSSDGRIVIFSDVFGEHITLWDFSNIDDVHQLVGPLDMNTINVMAPVGEAAISADTTLLAASGCSAVGGSGECSPNIIRLWDLSDKLSPKSLGDPLLAAGSDMIALSPNGKLLVSSATHGTVFWQMDSSLWRRIACSITGRNLSQSEWTQYFSSEPYRLTCPQWPAGQ